MRTAATPGVSPYGDLLGAAFASLHRHVQRAHLAPLAATGTIDVEHGARWFTPVLIRAMTLPASGAAQPVTLDVSATGRDMQWVRRIGRVVLRTRQRAEGGCLVERHGPGRIAFRIAAFGGGLVYEQQAIYLLGVRLPPWVAPRVSARIAPTPEGWTVDVTVTYRGELVCRYAGRMRPV
jgi:hypothetical protein